VDIDEMPGSARRLAFLDHSERISGMGSWEWVPATGELSWSDNHFRLFGLEPGAIVPSTTFVLEHTHPDDRELLRQAIGTLIAGSAPPRDLEYRILAVDGTTRTFSLTFAAIEAGDGLPRRIVGSVQDVSLLRRLDRDLAAHVAVTRGLDEWSSLEQGALQLLERLGDAMELPFGAFWVPDGATLVVQSVWHRPSPELQAVAHATREWRPGRGDVTLGRASAGRQPVISAQASRGGSAARHVAIQRAGLQGALAVPAVFVDETLAVLEFLSVEPIEPEPRLTRALNGIGHEIGHFLSHHRADLEARVLTDRGQEVLQLAARGHTAAAIARQLYLSPATVKRHFERAYAALGVGDRTAAVAEAMRRGMVT
jgi:DNA-binding CsgD family transcriptional regulator